MSLENWLTELISDFVKNSELNKFPGTEDNFWDTPVVGFSKGDDAYYSFFKEDIGDFYLSPEEFYRKEKNVADVDLGSFSVVSWILPQAKKTRNTQRKETFYPSKEWVLARLDGDEFNKKLSEHVADELEKKGIGAVAPMVAKILDVTTKSKYGYAANWSERHTAFVCGLGTFGLSDGLITAVGKAMRCGSVIFNHDITPTAREYEKHTDYCLFYSKDQACFKCAERCPVGAITKDGHDKFKCKEHSQFNVVPYFKKEYNIDSRGCGLCQVGVPCESRIPFVKK